MRVKLLISILLAWIGCQAGDGDWLNQKFVGTNLWYAPLLDQNRLNVELDSLKKMGITNLRIFIGSEGDKPHAYQVTPSLLLAPGVYNAPVLEKLDNLVDNLEERGMKGIFYLTNSWEWSGGYGQYLEWAGCGDRVLPENADWNDFCDYETKFYECANAQKIFRDHVAFIVDRYKNRPGIASWQLCNEPRPFSFRNKDAFADWVQSTAKLIKSIDPVTPVSVGSEGSIGCEMDLSLWKKIHSFPEIDYCTVHLWPTNWNWASRDNAGGDLDKACSLSQEYIKDHAAMAKELGKKLVISEFGYPRDHKSTIPASPTKSRDIYYDFIMSCSDTIDNVAGVNFWGWGGIADLSKSEYTCDPAHEAPGLYSVFAVDSSTIEVIKKHIKNLISDGK